MKVISNQLANLVWSMWFAPGYGAGKQVSLFECECFVVKDTNSLAAVCRVDAFAQSWCYSLKHTYR